MTKSRITRFVAVAVVLSFTSGSAFSQNKGAKAERDKEKSVAEVAAQAKKDKAAADKNGGSAQTARQEDAKLKAGNTGAQLKKSEDTANSKAAESRFAGKSGVNEANNFSTESAQRNKDIVAYAAEFLKDVGFAMGNSSRESVFVNGEPTTELLRNTFKAIKELQNSNGTAVQNQWRDISLIQIKDVALTLRQGGQATEIGAEIVFALARGLKGSKLKSRNDEKTNLSPEENSDYKEIFAAQKRRIQELLDATKANPDEFSSDALWKNVIKARNGVLEILENTAKNIESDKSLSYREAYVRAIDKYAKDRDMTAEDTKKVRRCMMKIAGI